MEQEELAILVSKFGERRLMFRPMTPAPTLQHWRDGRKSTGSLSSLGSIDVDLVALIAISPRSSSIRAKRGGISGICIFHSSHSASGSPSFKRTHSNGKLQSCSESAMQAQTCRWHRRS